MSRRFALSLAFVVAIAVVAVRWSLRDQRLAAPESAPQVTTSFNAALDSSSTTSEQVASTRTRAPELEPSVAPLVAATPEHERARIRGRLLDASDRPIAEAVVRVRYWHPRWPDDSVPPGAMPFLGEEGGEIRLDLDAAGEFAFDLPVPLRGDVSCGFSAGPFYETRGTCFSATKLSVECELLTPGEHWLDPIRLDAAGRVTGCVRSSEGLPIAGAVVHLGEQQARTGNDGSYAFDGLTPGVLRAVVYAPTYVASVLPDVSVEGGRTSAGNDCVLQRTRFGPVRGRVLDPDGTPVEGIRLEARAPDDRNPAIELVSASDGSFEFEVEAERVYTLKHADWQLSAGAGGSAEVKAGDEDVRILALRRTRHRVRVFDERTGEPIERYALHAALPPAPGVRLGWWSFRPERHIGGVREFDIDRERQWIRCSAPGYVLHEGPARARVDGPGSIALALRAGGAVRGVLVNGAGRNLTLARYPIGEHVAGADSRASEEGSKPALEYDLSELAGAPRWATCAADGSFEFDSLGTGTYELCYGDVHGAAPLRTALRVTAGEVLDIGRLTELSSHAVIYGRVLVAGTGSAREQDLLCKSVTKQSEPGHPAASSHAVLGVDGEFTLSGLSGGEYELTMRERSRAWLGVKPLRISVAPGEHRRVDWDLREYEPAWLELEVRDALHPVAGHSVLWWGGGDWARELGQLDAAGRVMGPVPTGKIVLTIASLGDHALDVELRPGERPRHTIEIACGELSIEMPPALTANRAALYEVTGWRRPREGIQQSIVVRATHDLTRWSAVSRIDEHGVVDYGHLSPGRWELTLREVRDGSAGDELAQTVVEVVAGEHARARFE